MKKLISGLAFAVAFAAASQANAADIAPVYKAPPPVVVTYNWTGFYVGGNAGYGWSNNDAALAPSPDATSHAFWNPAFAAGAAPSKFSLGPDGFIGGGQVGYNWQTGAWVFGLEADLQGADISASQSIATNVASAFVPGQFTGSQKLDWFGTARGRVGWAANNFLAYATGGFAYGHVKYGLNFAFPGSNDFQTISASNTATGWTVGGGFEWGAWSNWTFKVEYLYVDLGNESLVSVASGRAANLPTNLTMNFDNQYHIVRAGLNYRFDWGKTPVMAKY